MIQLTKNQRFTLSISAGIILILSFPFTGSIPFFAFLGLAPLLLIEDSIFSNQYKSSKLFIHSVTSLFSYIILVQPGGFGMQVLAGQF